MAETSDLPLNRPTLIMSIRNRTLVGFIALVLAYLATSRCSPVLPNGYTIISADRGKSSLANPDGTLVHGALIKQLFHSERQILLITFVATIEGEVEGPRPMDGNCYVALLIDSQTRTTRQVRLAEARHLAADMVMVEASNRKCLKGMPTA